MNKHSSLLQTLVNYRRKKCYNIGPRSVSFINSPNVIKNVSIDSNLQVERLVTIQPQVPYFMLHLVQKSAQGVKLFSTARGCSSKSRN